MIKPSRIKKKKTVHNKTSCERIEEGLARARAIIYEVTELFIIQGGELHPQKSHVYINLYICFSSVKIHQQYWLILSSSSFYLGFFFLYTHD